MGFFLTPCLSYITTIYENEMEIIMGIIEFVIGLGISFGPFFGAVIY